MDRASQMLEHILSQNKGYDCQPSEQKIAQLKRMLENNEIVTLDKAIIDLMNEATIFTKSDYVNYMHKMRERREEFGPFCMAFYYGLFM